MFLAEQDVTVVPFDSVKYDRKKLLVLKNANRLLLWVRAPSLESH